MQTERINRARMTGSPALLEGIDLQAGFYGHHNHHLDAPCYVSAGSTIRVELPDHDEYVVGSFCRLTEIPR